MESSPPPSPPKSPILAAQPRSTSPSPPPPEGAEAAFFRSSPPPDTGLEERVAAVTMFASIVMGQVEGKHQNPEKCAAQCLAEIPTILAMMESCSSGDELKGLIRDLLTGGSMLMLAIAALIYIVRNVDESKLPRGLVVSIACILTSVLFGVSLGKWGQYSDYIKSQLDNDSFNGEVEKLKEVLEKALDAAMAFRQSSMFLETD